MPGFGERKVIMCTQILHLMRVKHQSLVIGNRSTSGRVRPTQTLPCPNFSLHQPAAVSEVGDSAYINGACYNKCLDYYYICN